MSGWDAMVTDAAEQLRADHGLAQAAAETRAYDRTRMGVSYKTGHRRGFWDGVLYVLQQQALWDSLTEGEAIEELRKGGASLYHPLFKDDPRVWVDCPLDGRVTVGVEGFCDACGYVFCR
jgi:hypothetical protein